MVKAPTPSLLDRYLVAIVRHRWLVVALATVLMLAVTAGARFITVTSDYLVLFRDDNPQLLAFQALENTYSATDRALIRRCTPRGIGVHPRGARRHRGIDRRRVGSALFQSGRLPHQLFP